MTLKEKKKDIEQILEILYLILFAVIMAYLFLGKTAFEIPWNTLVRTESGETRLWAECLIEPPYYLLWAVVFLRYLFQEKYNWGMIFLAAALFVGGRYISHRNGYSAILLLVLLLLGAYNISYRKIIKVHFRVISSLLFLTFVCSLTGIIENYTYVLERGIRMSFGITYPINFAAFVFFQVLCWWYLRKERMTYLEAGVIAGLALFLKIFCDTRTSSFLLLGVALAVVWQRFRYLCTVKTGKTYKMNSYWSAFLTLAHPLAALGITIMTLLYPSQSKLLNIINGMFSGRLQLGKRAFDVYGVRAFGRHIRMFSHTEGTSGIYFYIDSSYVQLAIMYGLIMLVFILLAFLLIGSRARSQRDWTFLWILAFMAINCIMEQHILELQYCPFVLALFAKTKEDGGMEVKEIFGRKNG